MQSIMIQTESSPWCKAATWCYSRQRCKCWIVTGNHADDNWSFTYLSAALSGSRSSLQVSPVTLRLGQEAERSKLSSCHKNLVGIVQKPVSLFEVWFPPFFFLSFPFDWGLSLLFLLRPPTHVRAKMLPSSKGYSLFTLLFKIARTRKGCWIFFAFRKIGGSYGVIFFPLCKKLKRKAFLLSENTLLCIR